MITFDDCLAFCELTEEEIDAIAEHEHLPETVGARDGQLPDSRGRRARCASSASSSTTSAPRSGAAIWSTRRA